MIAAEVGASRHRIFNAELVNLRTLGSKARCGGVVGIQDCGIALGLIFEDAGFRGSVSVQAAVPIEMVRREIQQYSNIGPKSLRSMCMH